MLRCIGKATICQIHKILSRALCTTPGRHPSHTSSRGTVHRSNALDSGSTHTTRSVKYTRFYLSLCIHPHQVYRGRRYRYYTSDPRLLKSGFWPEIYERLN